MITNNELYAVNLLEDFSCEIEVISLTLASWDLFHESIHSYNKHSIWKISTFLIIRIGKELSLKWTKSLWFWRYGKKEKKEKKNYCQRNQNRAFANGLKGSCLLWSMRRELWNSVCAMYYYYSWTNILFGFSNDKELNKYGVHSLWIDDYHVKNKHK